MEEIDKNAIYTLSTVHKKGFIPMIKDFKTLREYINRGHLRASIYGAKKQKRYFVSGEAILEFLAKFRKGNA
mgnify:CR=1 FL=1